MDRLIEKIIAAQNPTVVGLDPHLDYIPDYIKTAMLGSFDGKLEGAAEAVIEFNKQLIDALCDIVPAVKPQAAYYEMLGWQGMRALSETVSYAKKKGLYVIVDGKRNDIGSTMEAYSAAYLGETAVGGEMVRAFEADALTVNGYLGHDGISPLIDNCTKFDRDIFVLVKTSNPGSAELQDQPIDGGLTVYKAMGELCEKWGSACVGKQGYSHVGAVVGATYPKQVAELRKMQKQTFFLIPGYGAQGAGAADIKGAFDERGLGGIVNSSRAIICAWKKAGAEKDFAKAAREEALAMKADLIKVIGKIG